MIQGMGAALSGLRAYINKTGTTANNLANLNTPGFKRSDAVTASLKGNMGTATQGVQTRHTQGAIVATGNAMDMAVSGTGFFQVKTPNGATGYTRAGAFITDNNSRLTDSAGNALQPEITIPGNATNVAIGRDGTVTANISGKQQTIGQVELASFNNPGGLERGGNNVYYETAASGQPVTGQPGTGGLGEIYPNALELSNVDLGEEMVNLIQNEHGFKAQLKTIQTTDEMLGSILDIKG